ncbi:MAG: hypothetical protein HC853_06820 [Anaerolineae bacterium]|nr:hypothetical protein [Anaerolineae bacterium]
MLVLVRGHVPTRYRVRRCHGHTVTSGLSFWVRAPILTWMESIVGSPQPSRFCLV